VEAFIQALESRVAAIGKEAEALLKAGEARAAELKTAFAAELGALLAELKRVVSSL
jgi:hypothetical protein